MNLIDKHVARLRLKEHLPGLPGREESEFSILAHLLPLLKRASKIISYVADYSLEVDVLPLTESCPLPRPTGFADIRHSAKWYFPKISEEDTLVFIRPLGWAKGKFGIWEPVGDEILRADEADLILVPALGYSVEGARLGRGGGYYDRVLSAASEIRLKTIGFTFSKVFPVPFTVEPHDIKVGKIITELGIQSFLD